MRKLLGPGGTVVTALLDDVGGAEETGERLAFGVARQDDPFGAELLGSENAHEADGAVADDAMTR